LSKSSEIWIVFDNDDMLKVKTAFTIVSAYNKSLKRKYTPIRIAYNAPTFETWGLLCCGATNISENRNTNKSELRKRMPTYNHQKSPRFDFDIIEAGYAEALKRAASWKLSLGNAPEYTATVFAGIYKLAWSIKE
jgi:hypothetical protein